MSIIIPGVELPPIDEYLHLRIDGNGYVSMQISENQYICDLYDTDKKAVELPPHGRCIDADKLGKSVQTQAEIVRKWGIDELTEIADLIEKGFLQEVENADTIIPADPADKDGT